MADSGRADELVKELDDIVAATLRARKHPPAVSRMLDEAGATIRVLSDKLIELQQFVILDATPEDDRAMVQARRAWDAIAPDVDETSVRELALLSPTLSTLHRAAVTVKSVHRFSEERIALAQFIGSSVGMFPRYVGQLVHHPNSKFNSFLVSSRGIDGVEKLIERLQRDKVITGFKIEGEFVNRKSNGRYWKPRTAENRTWKAESWRVTLGQVAPEWRSFLQGHWLTAYAYGIARDQFERVGADFEIYSNVQYTLPGDLGGGSSDLDVLVRTSDVILCIECKTGRVLSGQPTQVAKTVTAAQRFDRILDTMEVGLRRIYQLLYFESDTEPAEAVRAATSGHRVDVLVTSPSEVRLNVQRVANGQSIGISSAPEP